MDFALQLSWSDMILIIFVLSAVGKCLIRAGVLFHML